MHVLKSLLPQERAALSVEEFAHSMGLSRAFVFQQIADGAIRSFKLGRRRLVPFSERERLTKMAEPCSGEAA